jgi:membrane protein implicated in regulation of membrane protease activity
MNALLDRLAKSRRTVVAAVGTAGFLVVCCVVAPLALGVAGLLAFGIETAAITASATAVLLVIHHRRSCGDEPSRTDNPGLERK